MACCACSLGRQLRRSGVRAVLASSFPEVASWLQPDVVVVCRAGRAPVALAVAATTTQFPPPIVVSASAEDRPKPQSDSKGGASAHSTADGLSAAMEGLESAHIADAASGQTVDPSVTERGTDGPQFNSVAALTRGEVFLSQLADARFVCQSDELGSADLEDGCDDRALPERVVLAARVVTTAQTRVCERLFDAPFSGECATPLPRFPRDIVATRWRLGLLTGPSGSSKSALLRAHFGPPFEAAWQKDVSVRAQCIGGVAAADRFLDAAAMPCSKRDVPFEELSSGEQAQALLARALAKAAAHTEPPDRVARIDEFGSAWDGRTASNVAAALSAFLRSGSDSGVRVVLAGCRCGFVRNGALQPDWVFEAASAKSLRPATTPQAPSPSGVGPSLAPKSNDAETAARSPAAMLSRLSANSTLSDWEVCASARCSGAGGAVRLGVPQVSLHLDRCGHAEWELFKSFHYKSEHLSPQCEAYALYACVLPADAARRVCVPVGFCATIPHSGKRSEASRAPPRRAHRTVVLPDWQGLGIGSRLSDAVAQLNRRRGADYFGQTVHPVFGEYRDRSPLWAPTRFNHTRPELRIEGWRGRIQGIAVRIREPKLIYSHVYEGPKDDSAAEHLRRRALFAVDGLPEELSAGDTP
mmetsp:Transcript_6751/g.14802  ORF Transcript_6751/g.14802 Transcript_6751/m.14802 type:complete len:643 (+) Transcript_6751:458-2386(+)